MDGAHRIAAERQRQIDKEGWSEGHDSYHKHDELAMAAVCYAMPPSWRERKLERISPATYWGVFWPFDEEWWKPVPDNRIRELEKAGALIAAEIDRLLAAQEARA
jgi:hypothetical protein